VLGDHRHLTRLGRRAASRLILSTAAISVLAACTPAPSTPAPAQAQPKPTAGQAAQATPAAGSAAQSTPAASGAAQPKRGGTLRVGVASDVARLDGQLYSSINTTWMSFDRLTAYDAQLKATAARTSSARMSPSRPPTASWSARH
jgi:hypothetical protein